MATRPQTANILPWRLTPERAKILVPLAVAARIKANRLRALQRHLRQPNARTTLTGSKVVALLTAQADCVARCESQLEQLEAKVDALTRPPSRAEYVLAGVERHLGKALLPSPQVLKRRKKLTQTPTLAPSPSAPAADDQGFDPTAKPPPRLARPPTTPPI